jgi:hypothetical protein
MAVAKLNELAAPAAAAAPAADLVQHGATQKPLTHAEIGSVGIALGALVVGALVGIGVDDENRQAYRPPDGVSIFALFYVVAQAIERLLEPLSRIYGATPAPESATSTTAAASSPDPAGIVNAVTGLVTKSRAVKLRDEAMALSNPQEACKQTAVWQEVVDQIRRNASTLWAVASMIGMMVAGWLGLGLLEAVNAPDVPRELDIIVTGLVLGAGTKPLHDLISNVQASKEKKQNPDAVDGSSAS